MCVKTVHGTFRVSCTPNLRQTRAFLNRSLCFYVRILHEYRLSCFASISCVMYGGYFSGGGGVGMVVLLLLFGGVKVYYLGA